MEKHISHYSFDSFTKPSAALILASNLGKASLLTPKEYIRSKKQFLLTSRFNNKTWSENCDFKNRFSKISCVYCAPVMISSHIPVDAIMFILEMNNDTNTIMGIGMVRNHPSNKRLPVYKNENYNRYQYVGKHRIDRAEMNEEEETIMRVFDILCFRGNRHQKRGHGLKAFPQEMLFRCSPIMDLVDFIGKMFKRRLELDTPSHSIPLQSL
jgi:hypothetical protein